MKRLSSILLVFALLAGSAVLSVHADPPTYEISITPTAAAEVGDTVSATLNVDTTSFNAAQVDVEYDPALLEYVGIGGLGEAAGNIAVAKNGVVRIVNFGKPNLLSYTLLFKAKAPGNTQIRILSAAFGTEDDSSVSNLVPATIANSTMSVQITGSYFTVSYPTYWFTAPQSTVITGGTFTLHANADTWQNYDYGTVSWGVTGSGTISGFLTGTTDGVYTLPNVQNNITVYVNPSPRTYLVLISGNTAANDGIYATHGTPYSFTLPADTDKSTYTLESVTVGAYGDIKSILTVGSGRRYTIPGDLICGLVTVTVKRTDTETVPAYEINYDGANLGEGTVALVPQKDGSSAATLTLAPDEAYSYTVSASMDGQSAWLTADGDTYTVPKVSGDVLFHIEKTLRLETVSVAPYTAAGPSASIYLVTIRDTQSPEKRVYKYDGREMLYSEKYDAYSILIVSETPPSATAIREKITLAPTKASTFQPQLDVNGSGALDANDAQYLYNMYQGKYDGFTDHVSIDAMLKADLNGDGRLSILDAQFIVHHLFNQNQFHTNHSTPTRS